MKKPRLGGIARIISALAIIALAAGALAVVGLLWSGQRFFVSPGHIDRWIGQGDLIVASPRGVVAESTVIVRQLDTNQQWSIGRVQAVNPATGRIILLSQQGEVREVAPDMLAGSVTWSLSGLGGWLEWLGKPAHLLMGFLLPLTALVILELQHLLTSLKSYRSYRASSG